MGKKSTRENKNIYQQIREEMDLTRSQASELLECISDDRIEKIEYGTVVPNSDEILIMAEKYRKPELCNYYCTHECEIGKKYVPEATVKDLAQIVLEMLATINSLNDEKNRFIEIAVDGKISEEEKADFEQIKSQLDDMASAINSLQIWVEKQVK